MLSSPFDAILYSPEDAVKKCIMIGNEIKRVIVLLAFKIMTIWIVCWVFRYLINIVFLGSRIYIKSSRFTTLAEAEAMRFISVNTTVPVLKVYFAFKHKNQVYIVMERVKGRSLVVGWMQRSPGSKERVFKQL